MCNEIHNALPSSTNILCTGILRPFPATAILSFIARRVRLHMLSRARCSSLECEANQNRRIIPTNNGPVRRPIRNVDHRALLAVHVDKIAV